MREWWAKRKAGRTRSDRFESLAFVSHGAYCVTHFQLMVESIHCRILGRRIVVIHRSCDRLVECHEFDARTCECRVKEDALREGTLSCVLSALGEPLLGRRGTACGLAKSA